MFEGPTPANPGTHIFLSYRRADTAHLAGLLRDRLMSSLPDAQVFMDMHSIFPGDDFPEKIAGTLERTDVFLMLIGPEWLGAGASGHPRRIDDEPDFVRIEVATALETGVRVLPVLVEGTGMPTPGELPLDVGMIGRLNALRLREATFDTDCRSLIAAICEGGPRPSKRLPEELIGLWVSTGTGDAILQYDLYPNGTYQHVGIIRQQVSKGTFEFEVFHEGAVTVSGDSITFEAFRATASRSHPDYPAEDHPTQPRRPETTTSTWRLQQRGAQTFLVLGDGPSSAVVYGHLERTRSATRARQPPIPPAAPVGAGDTASGSIVDWFPLFGDERTARSNRRTGWKLLSTPGDAVVHLFDDQGTVYDIDIRPIPRDGTFSSFHSGERRLPIEIGWHGGGVHQGTRRDGTCGSYDVAPGYIARWVTGP